MIFRSWPRQVCRLSLQSYAGKTLETTSGGNYYGPINKLCFGWYIPNGSFRLKSTAVSPTTPKGASDVHMTIPAFGMDVKGFDAIWTLHEHHYSTILPCFTYSYAFSRAPLSSQRYFASLIVSWYTFYSNLLTKNFWSYCFVYYLNPNMELLLQSNY